MNEIHQRVFKIWGLINFNTKTLTLWLFYKNSKSVTLFPRSLRGGDGADKNFRPISTIMPYMNKIHQRVFKIWGLINFNAKTLTLWRKDEGTNERTNERTYVRTNERTYVRTNERTEKRKLYTPTYFVCRGYKYRQVTGRGPIGEFSASLFIWSIGNIIQNFYYQSWQNVGKYEYFPYPRYLLVNTGKYSSKYQQILFDWIDHHGIYTITYTQHS